MDVSGAKVGVVMVTMCMIVVMVMMPVFVIVTEQEGTQHVHPKPDHGKNRNRGRRFEPDRGSEWLSSRPTQVGCSASASKRNLVVELFAQRLVRLVGELR